MSGEERLLILRARQGDAEAFGALIAARRSPLVLLVAATLGDWDEAEDACRRRYGRPLRTCPRSGSQRPSTAGYGASSSTWRATTCGPRLAACGGRVHRLATPETWKPYWPPPAGPGRRRTPFGLTARHVAPSWRRSRRSPRCSGARGGCHGSRGYQRQRRRAFWTSHPTACTGDPFGRGELLLQHGLVSAKTATTAGHHHPGSAQGLEKPCRMRQRVIQDACTAL